MKVKALVDERDLLGRVVKGRESPLLPCFPPIVHVYLRSPKAYVNLRNWPKIVEDVFVKVWFKRTELPELRSFADWLFIVVRNEIYMYSRIKIAECWIASNWSDTYLDSNRQPMRT